MILLLYLILIVQSAVSVDISRRCYEILEVYQQRLVMYNLMNTEPSIHKYFTAPAFPPEGTEAQFRLNIYPEGGRQWNGYYDKARFGMVYMSGFREEELYRYDIFALDNYFDNYGDFLDTYSEGQLPDMDCRTKLKPVNQLCVYHSMKNITGWIQNRPLELFIELYRLRKLPLPNCLNKPYEQDVGRGNIPPRDEPDVFSYYCTMNGNDLALSKCSKYEPYFGFSLGKYAHKKKIGSGSMRKMNPAARSGFIGPEKKPCNNKG